MTPIEKGMKAFFDGNFGNPYKPNTQNHRDFELGFNQAYFLNREEYDKKINKESDKLHRSHTQEA